MSEEIQDPTLSKHVHDRLCSARMVLDTLEAVAPRLADQLGGLFGPWLAGPPPMAFASLLEAFHGRLSDCRDRLADVAERHLDVLTRAGELERRSDAANDRLANAMSALRATFRGVYGFAQLGHFGFPDRAPRRPKVLWDQSCELRQRLAEPDLELPPSRVPEFDLDCADLSRKLAPSIDGLDQALGAVRDHESRVAESERLQDEALAEFNEALPHIARSLESWLRMAGLDEQADRVRPSRRRPGVILAAVKSTSA
jgi:hypothetical protein